jgi:hypothetical protein
VSFTILDVDTPNLGPSNFVNPWRAVLTTADTLVLSNDELHAWIGLQHWTGVHPPASADAGSRASLPVPADLIGWLARDPDLRSAGPAEPVSLGGKAAHRVRLKPDPGRPHTNGPARGCSDAADCLVLADTPDGLLTIPQDSTADIWIPDHSPRLILTVILPTAHHASDQKAITDLITSRTYR